MADYYPLIARAVTGLDKSTGEARRGLYERARTALVTQLRGVEPALSEADITRERLALEDAIRKVEGESARRPRQEPAETPVSEQPSPPPPPPPEIPPPPDWEELQRELDGLAPPPEERVDEPERDAEIADSPPPEAHPPEPLRSEASLAESALPLEPEAPPEPEPPREPPAESISSVQPSPPEPAPPETPALPPRFGRKFATNHPSLIDEGLKGFRDVVAETDDLGGATASASKSARETRDAFAAMPPSHDPERVEPRVDSRMEPLLRPDDLKPSREALPSSRPGPRAAGRGRQAPPHPPAEEFEDLEETRLRSGGVLPKIIAVVAIVALIGAGIFAYRQWGSGITGMFQSARTPATQAPKEASQGRPKISDRIGGTQQDSSARPAPAKEAAVAQRAILVEAPGNPQAQARQFVGSVIWRAESVSPGPGQPAEAAIKAEVEIPERQVRMSLVIQRNKDASLPASHTIEVLFSTPADFPSGGIGNLNNVLMENNPQGRGEPLSGLGVKVTNGFFLVGLSSNDGLLRRNMGLLNDRAWLNLQLTYNDGQRAILVMEKGVPGDRVVEDTLNAWGQMPPSAGPTPAQPR